MKELERKVNNNRHNISALSIDSNLDENDYNKRSITHSSARQMNKKTSSKT